MHICEIAIHNIVFLVPPGTLRMRFLCIFHKLWSKLGLLRHVDSPKSNIDGNKSYWYDPQLLMYEIETRKVVVLVPPEDVTMRFCAPVVLFQDNFLNISKSMTLRKKCLR